jgi:hypothetical protein
MHLAKVKNKMKKDFAGKNCFALICALLNKLVP